MKKPVQTELGNWGQVPNALTVFRLILCVVYVACTAVHWPYMWTAALVLFVTASLTDWLDGLLARAWGVESALGKLLDPLADKILIAAALIGLAAEHALPAWMVTTILAREFVITGLRTMAALHQQVLSSDRLGKWKTVAQIVAVIVALTDRSLQELFNDSVGLIAFLQKAEPWGFLIALFLTIFSGVKYVIKNRNVLA